MKTLLFLFALSGLLCLTACEDLLDPNLPAATQKGANTLGFKVDGKNWVPYYTGVSVSGETEIEVGYNEITHGFFISANRIIKSIDQGIHISLDSLINPGEYYSDGDISQLRFYDDNKENFTYNPVYSEPGSFVVTKLDTLNQIISGTFFFTVENSAGEQLEIIDGRFDFKYPYRK